MASNLSHPKTTGPSVSDAGSETTHRLREWTKGPKHMSGPMGLSSFRSYRPYGSGGTLSQPVVGGLPFGDVIEGRSGVYADPAFHIPCPAKGKPPRAATKEQIVMLYTVWLQTRERPDGIRSPANTAAEALDKIRLNRALEKDVWALDDSGSEVSEAELTRHSLAERR